MARRRRRAAPATETTRVELDHRTADILDAANRRNIGKTRTSRYRSHYPNDYAYDRERNGFADRPHSQTVKRTVRIRKRKIQRRKPWYKQIAVHDAINKALASLGERPGVALKARARTKCENNKAARRSNYFKSGAGKRPAYTRKHRC